MWRIASLIAPLMVGAAVAALILPLSGFYWAILLGGISVMLAAEDFSNLEVSLDFLALYGILQGLRFGMVRGQIIPELAVSPLIAASMMVLIFLLFRKKLGAGDVLLLPLAAIGSDFTGLFSGLLLASLGGLVYIALFALVRRVPIRGARIPFVPFILIGMEAGRLFEGRLDHLLERLFS